jgi:hypothetical protein
MATLMERTWQAESGNRQFDDKGNVIVSPVGAIGISQIMPTTAPEAARLAGLPYDARRLREDEAYNRALGQAYSDHLVKTFGGDESKAAAAYNAGAGRVNSAIKRAEKQGGDWRDYLPAETKGYLQKVIGGGVEPKKQKTVDELLADAKKMYPEKFAAVASAAPKKQKTIDELLADAKKMYPDKFKEEKGLLDQAGEGVANAVTKAAKGAVGAGEAALTLGTGVVGGLVGAGSAIVQDVTGNLPKGVTAEQLANQRAEAMTYQPRTEPGRQSLQAIGELAAPLESLNAVAPMMDVANVAAQAAQQGGRIAGRAVQQGGAIAQQGAKATQQAVAPAVGKAAKFVEAKQAARAAKKEAKLAAKRPMEEAPIPESTVTGEKFVRSEKDFGPLQQMNKRTYIPEGPEDAAAMAFAKQRAAEKANPESVVVDDAVDIPPAVRAVESPQRELELVQEAGPAASSSVYQKGEAVRPVKPETSVPLSARVQWDPTPDPEKDSVLEFIAKMGGINRASRGVDELYAALKMEKGSNAQPSRILHLFTKKGITLDDMAQRLQSAGYLREHDIKELVKNLEDGGGDFYRYGADYNRINRHLEDMEDAYASAGGFDNMPIERINPDWEGDPEFAGSLDYTPEEAAQLLDFEPEGNWRINDGFEEDIPFDITPGMISKKLEEFNNESATVQAGTEAPTGRNDTGSAADVSGASRASGEPEPATGGTTGATGDQQGAAQSVKRPAEFSADQRKRDRHAKKADTPDRVNGVDPEVIADRIEVLKSAGFADGEVPQAYITGNMHGKYMLTRISKGDDAAGKKAASIIQNMNDKVKKYAESALEKTGGTPWKPAQDRGAAIIKPLQDYADWYKNLVGSYYQEARKKAAEIGGGVEMKALRRYVSAPEHFEGIDERQGVGRALNAYLKRQNLLDENGKPLPMSVNAAESLKQALNEQYTYKNGDLIRKIKDAIDDDVLRFAGVDVFKKARKARAEYASIFENKDGIAKLLEIDDLDINRKVPLEKVPDNIANLAFNNQKQFDHIIDVFKSLPIS